MAEHKFIAALNASEIPFVSRFKQRPVVIAGLDNRLKQANQSTRDDENDNNVQNLPQIYYAENLMPTVEGIKSVGYDAIQAQVGGTSFDEVFILRNETEDTWFFSPAQGNNYVTPAFGTAWTSTDPLAGLPVGNDVSIAYVNGVTYVLYAGLWIGHWDGTNFVDDTATIALPPGYTIADVKCICGSGNYLCLLMTDLSFCWSSLIDPLDFEPSLDTGAGMQIPVDVRGEAVAITQVTGGVIINCGQNAVAAMSTNNSLNPWTFREIRNAGGITTRKAISTDNTSGALYIWGTNGFQRLSLRESETLFPEASDFLAGRLLETYSSGTLSISKLSSDFNVKVAYIAGRFVIISYGTGSEYSYALVFDLKLRRWGKLKTDHIDCFSQYGNVKNSICFLRRNGAVNQLVLDDRALADAGIMILGRYQLNRTNQLGSSEVECECLDNTESFSVIVSSNFNGTTVGEQATMTLAESDDNYRKFQHQLEGENLSFIFSGTFNLSTVLFTFLRGAAF